MRSSIAKIALVGAQLCLASLMVIGREALDTIPSELIVFSRVIGATIIFWCLALLGDGFRVRREDWPRLVCCGVLGAAANQIFFVYGLERTTATNASVLSTSIPILTLLASIVFGGESLTLGRLLGILLGFSGALFLVISGGDLSGGTQLSSGNVLILGNCVCWALFLSLVRPLAARYPAMGLAARLFGVGALCAAPLTLQASLQFLPSLTHRDAAYLAFIILVPTVGTYALNQLAMRAVDASVVATYWYLLPVFGALGAALRLGETIAASALLAAALIGVGIFLTARSAGAEGAAEKRSGWLGVLDRRVGLRLEKSHEGGQV